MNIFQLIIKQHYNSSENYLLTHSKDSRNHAIEFFFFAWKCVLRSFKNFDCYFSVVCDKPVRPESLNQQVNDKNYPFLSFAYFFIFLSRGPWNRIEINKKAFLRGSFLMIIHSLSKNQYLPSYCDSNFS